MPKKFSKHILTKKLIREIPYYTGKSIVAHDGELNAECSMGYHCISKPISFDLPHSHDFEEMLCFIGGDPTNILDLGAEIEFTLGGEKHSITKAAVVSIPKGLVHCPIVFRKVKKPIVFLEVSLTRIWKPAGSPLKKSIPARVLSGTKTNRARTKRM
ncbi:MAG: hypothetical protein JXA73_04105 [Acidobacteria bacterium]|nr:hypothetical protein [Acidobacteriota bacterium]